MLIVIYSIWYIYIILVLQFATSGEWLTSCFLVNWAYQSFWVFGKLVRCCGKHTHSKYKFIFITLPKNNALHRFVCQWSALLGLCKTNQEISSFNSSCKIHFALLWVCGWDLSFIVSTLECLSARLLFTLNPMCKYCMSVRWYHWHRVLPWHWLT